MKKKTIISIIIGVLGAALIGLGIYFRGSSDFNITVLGAIMIAIGIPIIILNFLANKKKPINLKKVFSNFFEKHDLLKITSILTLLAILLTWFVKKGYFDTSAMEMVVSDVSRVGIMDIFTYSYLSVYYFTVLVTLLFVLGGFYGVLAKSNGYQNLVERIAKVFKSKEKVLIICTMFIFAAITAVTSEMLVPVIFAPFAITIILSLTKDKILAFVATFGGILVGTIGDLTSMKIAGSLVSAFGVEYTTNIWIKILLLGVSFVLLVISVLMYMKKAKPKTKDKEEKAIDLFEVSKPKNKKGTALVAITLIIFTIITILAYIPWENAFELEWALNFHTWLTELELFKTPVIGYLLGKVNEFGNWDLFAIQAVMAITAIVVALLSKLSLNEFIETFADGMKRMTKAVITLIFVYLIIEFAISFPVLPTIFAWMLNLTKGFSHAIASVVIFIASLFGVEMQYTLQLSGLYLASEFADSTTTQTLAVMYQAIYGFCAFFAPSSLALMLGLSYLDIPYKKWFKFIWKFLLAMLVVVILIIIFII